MNNTTVTNVPTSTYMISSTKPSPNSATVSSFISIEGLPVSLDPLPSDIVKMEIFDQRILAALDSSGSLVFYGIGQNHSILLPTLTTLALADSISDFTLYSDPSYQNSSVYFECFVLEGSENSTLEIYSFGFDLSYYLSYWNPSPYSFGAKVIIDNSYNYLYVFDIYHFSKIDLLDAEYSDIYALDNNGFHLSLVVSTFASTNSSANSSSATTTPTKTFNLFESYFNAANSGSDGGSYSDIVQLLIMDAKLYVLLSNNSGVAYFDVSSDLTASLNTVDSIWTFDSMYKYEDQILFHVFNDSNTSFQLFNETSRTFSEFLNSTSLPKQILLYDNYVIYSSMNADELYLFDMESEQMIAQVNDTNGIPVFLFPDAILLQDQTDSSNFYILPLFVSDDLEEWWSSSSYAFTGKYQNPLTIESVSNITRTIDSDFGYFDGNIHVEFAGYMPPYQDAVVSVTYIQKPNDPSMIMYVDDYDTTDSVYFPVALQSKLKVSTLLAGECRIRIDQSNPQLLNSLSWPLTFLFQVENSRGGALNFSVSVYNLITPVSTSYSSATVLTNLNMRSYHVSSLSGSQNSFASLETRLGGFLNLIIIFGLVIISITATFASCLWCYRTKTALDEAKGLLSSITKGPRHDPYQFPDSSAPMVSSTPMGSEQYPISSESYGRFGTGSSNSGYTHGHDYNLPSNDYQSPNGYVLSPPPLAPISPVSPPFSPSGHASIVNGLKSVITGKEATRGDLALSISPQLTNQVSKDIVRFLKAFHPAGDLIDFHTLSPNFVKAPDIFLYAAILIEMLAAERGCNPSTDATAVLNGQSAQKPMNRALGRSGILQITPSCWFHKPILDPSAEGMKPMLIDVN